MDSLSILLSVALTASAAVNVMLAFLVRQAMKDSKELAREALLASKADSAEDLALAAQSAHQAALERELPVIKPKSAPAGVANPNPQVPIILGRDGRPLVPMKPIG